MKICIAGAGGFIGGHLAKRLIVDGHTVYGIDIKPVEEWWYVHPHMASVTADLREAVHARICVEDADWVINLAAEMGGMGYISSHDADCLTNVLINTNLLRASVQAGVSRYFFASSACAYSKIYQSDDKAVHWHPHNMALAERYVYPYEPDSMYGWEKLFSEFTTTAFAKDYGLDVRIARIHNCYGPNGTWDGGREKAPAAMCRKVSEAIINEINEIEIWGDGNQTRSFMYVDDCVEGIIRLMNRERADVMPDNIQAPINLGSSEMVSVTELARLVEQAASRCIGREVRLNHRHKLDAPQGVRGRSSDNTRIKSLLGWEPSTSLADGIDKTYRWIDGEVRKALRS